MRTFQQFCEAIDRPDAATGQGYDDSYMHNPYHGVIRKYGYQYSHSTPGGPGQRTRHTYKQGSHYIGVAGNQWSTSDTSGAAAPVYGGHPNTARAGADLERHLLDKADKYGLEGP
jgi:hypothetical protein